MQARGYRGICRLSTERESLPSPSSKRASEKPLRGRPRRGPDAISEDLVSRPASSKASKRSGFWPRKPKNAPAQPIGVREETVGAQCGPKRLETLAPECEMRSARTGPLAHADSGYEKLLSAHSLLPAPVFGGSCVRGSFRGFSRRPPAKARQSTSYLRAKSDRAIQGLPRLRDSHVRRHSAPGEHASDPQTDP